MKVGGKSIEGPKKTLIVIPRQEGDIAFTFVGVNDEKKFETQFPAPQPPTVTNVKLGTTGPNFEDEGYKKKFEDWLRAKTAWYFLESSRPSNIEWDTVRYDDCNTFVNWQDDLRAAGFSTSEINRLYDAFTETNMLTEQMLDEARKRFLASQEAIAQ
jgi:hypothetical protein